MIKENELITSESELFELKKELYNKPEIEIENCVKSLKDWIKKQPHFPQNEDEKVLRKMLTINKFSVEKTKSKLEVYYSARNFLPEFFINNHPLHPSMQKANETCLFLPLPLLTAKLERITILALSKNISAENFDVEVVNRLIITTIEVRLIADLCLGDIFIIDMSTVNYAIISKISPRIIHNSLKFLIGAYSDRIKQIHFINVPSFAEFIVLIIKSILKTKMAERVHTHKDTTSLNKFIPNKLLPKDFGGSLKSIEEIKENWRIFMESKNDWIISRNNMKTNEKLRIGTNVSSELFGLQGSFQTLCID